MTLTDTLRHLSLSAPDPRLDGELVARFVATWEEPAFAELLRRHGPAVYGVCRRVGASLRRQPLRMMLVHGLLFSPVPVMSPAIR